MNCPECNTSIQGYYYSPNVLSIPSYDPPAFCHNCGKPYPWTKDKLHAAQELILEDESLSPDDKEVLSKALPDLVADTPRTQLAATRFKKLIGKAVTLTSEGLKQILIDIASETAKKMLYP
jgi:hypothetical protein